MFIPSTPHHVLPFSLFVFKYFVLGGDVLMGCSPQYCIKRVDRVIGPTSQSPWAPFGIWPLSFIRGISPRISFALEVCHKAQLYTSFNTRAQGQEDCREGLNGECGQEDGEHKAKKTARPLLNCLSRTEYSSPSARTATVAAHCESDGSAI